jgi:hypothetical protein
VVAVMSVLLLLLLLLPSSFAHCCGPTIHTVWRCCYRIVRVGDVPEDVLGGILAAVRRVSWASSDDPVSRVIVHCGDAPPHGSPKHHSYADSSPDGHDRDPTGTPEALFTQLRDSQIEYSFQKLNGECDKMLVGTVWHA